MIQIWNGEPLQLLCPECASTNTAESNGIGIVEARITSNYHCENCGHGYSIQLQISTEGRLLITTD
jgi:transposase-like protein